MSEWEGLSQKPISNSVLSWLMIHGDVVRFFEGSVHGLSYDVNVPFLVMKLSPTFQM